MFADRQQAGRLLCNRLKDLLSSVSSFRPETTVVVGLPRGGVPVAAEIARGLNCPVDLLVSKKIRAPDNPELAIGAVSSSGVVVLAERIPTNSDNHDLYKEAQQLQTEQLVRETRDLECHWIEAAGLHVRLDWRDRLVILVDDGIATGMTTLAALRTVTERGAAQIWLATPVVPYDTCVRLKEHCDNLVALSIPYNFSAVGCFYRDFHQVGDDEVTAALKSAISVGI